MLAADAHLQVGVGAPSAFEGHLDQLADALLVDGSEGVCRQDPFLEVHGQEAGLGVVAREAQRRLRQVVAADAEEAGEAGGGQRGRRECGAGELLAV